MTYDILKTGSAGNAVVINGEILIDCGVSMKLLRESGYIANLKLVLLTHKHGDHFNPATVQALHKGRPALRFGCCEWMVPLLMDVGVNERSIDLYFPKIVAVYSRFAVCPAELPHDVPNCGYFIWHGSERLFYATDCSTLDGIEAKDCNLYLIESNHTKAEIEARIAEKRSRGEFAYESRAAQTHLSQEQAMDWLARNAGPNSRYVFLHQHKEGSYGLDTP